jgi:hypothetical protein
MAYAFMLGERHGPRYTNDRLAARLAAYSDPLMQRCKLAAWGAGSFHARPQMKVLVLAPFAAAIICSIIWYEAAERNLTRMQKTAFGATALAAWILVLVVGSFVT